MKKSILLSLVFISFVFLSKAQENKGNINYSIHTDIRNIHVWRGGLTVNTLNIQPAMYGKYKNSFGGVWACYSEDGKFAEVDLYLGYSIKNFTATLFDFYCPDMQNGGNNFLEIDKKSTRHIFDMKLNYKLEKLPLGFVWSTYIFGDYEKKDSDNRYSSYFETNYSLPFNKWKFDFFMGATPFEGAYANRAALINSGATVTYLLDFGGRFKIPIYCSTIVNPYKSKGYLMVGLTIKFSNN